MESWRRVEVAACEELPALLGEARAERGGARGDPRARRSRSRPSTSASRSPTTTWRRSSTCSPPRPAGGPLDPLRADLLRRARHRRSRCSCAPSARSSSRAPTSSSRRSPRRAREHAGTLCVGRTHGVHAEPTTFGVKLAGFAFEAHRNAGACARAFEQVAVGALSGAVGTYAATDPEFEARVLARLGLAREDVSTQVVARDRHAELLERDRARRRRPRAPRDRRSATSSAPRCARCRSRSAPARRAPRRCPTSATRSRPSRSRASRGCCAATRSPALEDVALWHERDISHSSVERVILPDSTILIDYLQHRAIALVAA